MAVEVEKCRITGFEFMLILVALGIVEQSMFSPCRAEIFAQAQADAGRHKSLRIPPMVSISKQQQA